MQYTVLWVYRSYEEVHPLEEKVDERNGRSSERVAVVWWNQLQAAVSLSREIGALIFLTGQIWLKEILKKVLEREEAQEARWYGRRIIKRSTMHITAGLSLGKRNR